MNQEYVYPDIKGNKHRKERLGAASDFFFDRLTMRNVQLVETDRGFRMHTVSKNKLTNRTIF